MKNNIKTIELTRKIREKQYDEIKNKNRSEIINYFRSRSEKINKELKTARD